MHPAEYQIMYSVEDSFWWYQVLRGEIVRRVRREVSRQPAPQLLDAGCGTGGMLAALRAANIPGLTLHGVDLSPHGLEWSRQRGFAQVQQASVCSLPHGGAQFDVVVSLDVLSAAGVDLPSAVFEMHRVLKPGGLLLVNLPAFRSLAGEHDAAVMVERRFSRKELPTLFPATAWTQESAGYWNQLLFPAIWFSRWRSRQALQRKAPASQDLRSDLKPLPHWLNSALTTLGRMEFRLLQPWSPLPGSSLLASLRKIG